MIPLVTESSYYIFSCQVTFIEMDSFLYVHFSLLHKYMSITVSL